MAIDINALFNEELDKMPPIDKNANNEEKCTSKDMKNKHVCTVVMMRHGQSQFNVEDRFCGWFDTDITQVGMKQAKEAGENLKAKGYKFDCAFTSLLTRTNKTLEIALEEMNQTKFPFLSQVKLFIAINLFHNNTRI